MIRISEVIAICSQLGLRPSREELSNFQDTMDMCYCRDWRRKVGYRLLVRNSRGIFPFTPRLTGIALSDWFMPVLLEMLPSNTEYPDIFDGIVNPIYRSRCIMEMAGNLRVKEAYRWAQWVSLSWDQEKHSAYIRKE